MNILKSKKLMMVSPVLSFVLILALVMLLLPSLILPFWVIKFKGIEQKVELISHSTSSQIISEIGRRSELLSTMNSTASTLARVLNSSLDGLNISFSTIEDHVSPILFQAISTIPIVANISYKGLENLFFSYHYEGDQLLAVYNNDSKVANMRISQQVNPDNGKLFGEPTILPKTGGNQDYIFTQTIELTAKGFLSLAFSKEMVGRFFSGFEIYNGYFCLATRDGKVIVKGVQNSCLVLHRDSAKVELLKLDDPLEGNIGNFTSDYDGLIKIRGSDHRVFCSTINILGVQSVYTLALPLKEEFIHTKVETAFVLSILTLITMIISVLAFFFMVLKAKQREMYLCSELIKQMESTQQTERKYLNKSLAFASASHDVRASLAGITGLTQLSLEGIDPASDLGSNLKQIEGCSKDLLVILNTILDTSKIEAGKMQLEQEEFNLAQLLEDVVDLFHPVGLKKGVDVILDPCDGSIFSEQSKVKGDRTKLRQILSNLLSNAVKFTYEGHVVVRCWAKTPHLETPLFSSIHSSIQKSKFFCLASCLFSRKNEEVSDEQHDSGFTSQENSETLEFVFEVEDSGVGIPKEKQNSVFENYVQVKEKAQVSQEGTGLGLGIVQSLVRLMGGDIKIKDKEVGEKGTCFKFNIVLAKSETSDIRETRRENGSQEECSLRNSLHYHVPRPSPFSSKQYNSKVVLFIQGEERRKVSQKFMEMSGLNVSIVKEWNQLSHTLKKVKKKLSISKYSISSISSSSFSSEFKSQPLSIMDGDDEMPAYLHKRSSSKIISPFVLIIIDTSGGPFRDLSRAVAEFRRDFRTTCCRIVWLDKPGAQNMIHLHGLDEDKLPLTDSIISKPFHGSRLYRVIGLLPEFGGTLPSPKSKKDIRLERENLPPSSIPKNIGDPFVSKSKSKEIEGPKTLPGDEILSGKKILVVDDNMVLRKIAVTNISKLGAIVESCVNGEEALQLVIKGLSDGEKHRAINNSLPYDYILMDCQMPVMDGFEATRRIREEEEQFGIHIPIIALTAHTAGEEAAKMIQTGMDFFLTKPFNKDRLIEAIINLHS